MSEPSSAKQVPKSIPKPPSSNKALSGMYSWGAGLFGVGFVVGVIGFSGLSSYEPGAAYAGFGFGVLAVSLGAMLIVAAAAVDAINWQIRESSRGTS